MSAFLDPTGKRLTQQGALAPRKRSLQGLTVGLVDNTKRNANHFLAALGQELVAHYGVKDVVTVAKGSASVPVGPKQFDDLAKAHVIIAGVGD